MTTQTSEKPHPIPPVVSLHRYFIWANRMRTHVDALLAAGEVKGTAEFEFFMYLSYWYGGLYVVIEGWRELGLADHAIDSLLQSPNVELLRRYRNGAFHFQTDYHDPRFTDFMKPENESVEWIRALNLEFGRYFLASTAKATATRTIP